MGGRPGGGGGRPCHGDAGSHELRLRLNTEAEARSGHSAQERTVTLMSPAPSVTSVTCNNEETLCHPDWAQDRTETTTIKVQETQPGISVYL